ncbi:MAG: recombinase family protein [Candidatus Bathyarchaeia archaeon]
MNQKIDNSANKKGVIYAKAKSVAYESIDSQIKLCREKMKADSVEEVHAPITDLVSANDTQSSGLMEVLKLAENKSIDFVYTSGLDRLSRNSMVLLNFLSKLRGYNVTVVTPFQIFDTKKLEDLMS